MKSPVTAGLIIIGNELLSGQTADQNMRYICQHLGAIGVDVREASFIPDIAPEIIRVVQDFSQRFSYVFTTGGIGPTHDDITAEAVAKAFQRSLILHPEAHAALKARYKPEDLNTARLRMAHVPEGATLIANKISAAPGFQVENVFVMAGIPSIMKAMLAEVLPTLKPTQKKLVKGVTCKVYEGDIARDLADIQEKFQSIEIGSYPHWIDGHADSLHIVLKGYDIQSLHEATQQVLALCQAFDGNAATRDLDQPLL